jgi:hypothetical protein
MKTSHKILVAGVVLAGTAACIVPPSMFEQASWSPSGEYWQNQGRYRQVPPETAVQPAEQPLAQADVGAAERGPAGVPAAPPEQGVPEMEMPLYSWDGGVVDGAPQGRVAKEHGSGARRRQRRSWTCPSPFVSCRSTRRGRAARRRGLSQRPGGWSR